MLKEMLRENEDQLEREKETSRLYHQRYKEAASASDSLQKAAVSPFFPRKQGLVSNTKWFTGF